MIQCLSGAMNQKNMRPSRRITIPLAMLQGVIGLGAIGGGAFLILDPSGESMGFSLELLQGSPFKNYLIPGLFLFLVNGVGSLVGSGLTARRNSLAGSLALVLGLILMAWIVIQVAIIGLATGLQPLFFALGLVEAILGWILQRRGAPVASSR